MEIIIANKTAADFWRLVYPLGKRLGPPPLALGPLLAGDLAVNCADVWALAPPWVTPRLLELQGGVLHVLAHRAQDRRVARHHVVHLWKGPLPPGSLYAFGDGAYISSPAFTFLQLAHEFTPIRLAAYASELCGTFALNPMVERGLVQREPALMTLAQLADYLDGASGAPACAKARAALALAVEGAASPREVLVAQLLSLPYRRGGYGLPRPLLNYRVDLDSRARALYGRGSVRADLCYPGVNLAIEYLGEYDHGGAAAMRSDRARTNALVEMGFEVIELTAQQVNDPVAFEVIALRIAARLGKRVKAADRGLTPARLRLRADLG